MRIVVPIKQVPETSAVTMDEQTGTMIREGVEAIINPLDLYAIEVAIRLREARGGETIAVSMGPPKAVTALKEALAMGIDTAVLITDKAFAGSDTWATSYVLAAAIRRIGEFDLVICGERATDGDTGQVGPGIAEHLGIPQATYAVDVEIEERTFHVKRLLAGRFETVEMKLPALLTADKHMNNPRHAGLRGVMAARKEEIATWSIADIEADPERCGLSGSPTTVVEIFPPQRSHKGERLEGEPHDVACQLFAKLRENQII